LAVTASALIANTAITSALGMVFWIMASRVYSPADLGGNAALISVMMLLSVVSQLDLAMGISRLLPQVRERRWRQVLAAYSVTAIAALLVGGGFVIVAPRLLASFAFLGHDPLLGVALVVSVVLWNVFALQDAVLTSARWATAVPVENGIFGLIKIALMLLLAHSFAGHGVFIAWLLAMAVMLVPVNALIFLKVLVSPAPPGEKQRTTLSIDDRGGVTRFLAMDYVAALLNQGYTALLPLLVVTVLGRDANAYFYIAFVIAGAVRAVAQSMSTSLVVEGAHNESELGTLARLSVMRYVKFVVPATAALTVGSHLLLIPFGSSYVRHGAALLELLLVATVPQAVITLYIGIERVRTRVSRVLAIETTIVILVTIGGALSMRSYGLVGLGVIWLAAHVLVATLVVSKLWRVCMESAPTEGTAAA
jgi:O-antigen/teichoic acid export membrane protein